MEYRPQGNGFALPKLRMVHYTTRKAGVQTVEDAHTPQFAHFTVGYLLKTGRAGILPTTFAAVSLVKEAFTGKTPFGFVLGSFHKWMEFCFGARIPVMAWDVLIFGARLEAKMSRR